MDIDEPCDLNEVIERNFTAPITAPTSVKYEVFPIKRNQLFVRLENIGDRFDTAPWNLSQVNTTVSFPLDQFARKLFNQSNHNPLTKLGSIVYQELSLTGNQLYSNVTSSKTNWNINMTTALYPYSGKQAYPAASDFTSIDLVQQRIRMFNVTYVTTSSIEENAFFLQ